MSKFQRPNTIEIDTEQSIIDPNKQQCIAVLGRKGKGKSYLLESLAVQLYLKGQTVFDMYASDNLENAFYCIKDKIQIPVTLLGPESLSWDQLKLDKNNNRIFSKEEYYKQHPQGNFNMIYPPNKPRSQWGKEWLRIEKLPPAVKPTKANPDPEENQRIVEIFKKVLLECREERRILVFNPLMFPDEGMMYLTLEVIIRCFRDIRKDHFVKPTEELVGKEKKDWGVRERSWNKLCLVIRELAELCPAKLKGDKTGESLRVKKAMLQFMRKARHYLVNCLADWQNYMDVDSGVRSQFDQFILKKWTKRLAGDEWNWAFDFIDTKRRAILEPARFSRRAFQKADRRYPPLELLDPHYMYHDVGDRLVLWPVPNLLTHHKEADEDFSEFTGITFWHQEEMIARSGSSKGDDKVTSKDEKLFVALVSGWKGKLSREEMIGKLAVMQEKKEITWNIPFIKMKQNTFSKRFTALHKKHGEIPVIVTK